jgi:hypothetical protein
MPIESTATAELTQTGDDAALSFLAQRREQAEQAAKTPAPA